MSAARAPAQTAPVTATGTIARCAWLLPGLAALSGAPALAETAPEQASLTLRYADYRDSQPGLKRVSVRSPQVHLQVPVAGEWSFDATAVGDSVSGATPRLHTQSTSASRMADYRRAYEVKVTRYLPRASYAVSLGLSDENDYRARAYGLTGRWATEDNNTALSLGMGFSDDLIDASRSGAPLVVDQRRHTHEWQIGLTQVLTAQDIVQASLTHTLARGYLSDPYKLFDARPPRRAAWIGVLRWNHHMPATESTLRTSWRYYQDGWDVRAHTLAAEWVQPLGRWQFTPGLRYHTQSAADFYVDPVLNARGGYDTPATLARLLARTPWRATDQRLAGWGAVTLSLAVAYEFAPGFVADLKLERYRQQASWRAGGAGSAGLDRFDARIVQLGLTRRF